MTIVSADEREFTAAEPTWHRLHPLTPLVRGWKVLAVGLAWLGQNQGPLLIGGDGPTRRELNVVVLVLVVAVIALAGYCWLAWRRSRYAVTADSLQLATGVLFRQTRHARLDRLQSVDMVRPLLARLFGLAELRLEVAGGLNSKVALSLLREGEAQQLRNLLLARAAGLTPGEGPAPRAPETRVLQVPVERTVAALIRSGALVMWAVYLGILGVVSILTRSLVAVPFWIPAAVGVATGIWSKFNSGFGFSVASSPDGIRLRHGLLTKQTQTVPPGRVQAIRLTQPLLWRRQDWWRVTVNVAGSSLLADAASGQTSDILLTVGTRAEALAVLRLALPSITQGSQVKLLAGLTGTGIGPGFVVAPDSARWLDPLGWRRHGVWVGEELLLLRGGRLIRKLDIVPHARIQSLGVEQGPLQRRLGLATFVAHSTPGPVTPQVEHLRMADAAILLTEQSARAQLGRADRHDPQQGPWIQRPQSPL